MYVCEWVCGCVLTHVCMFWRFPRAAVWQVVGLPSPTMQFWSFSDSATQGNARRVMVIPFLRAVKALRWLDFVLVWLSLNFQPDKAIWTMLSVAGKQALSRSIPLFSGPKPKGNLHSSIIKDLNRVYKDISIYFP